MKLKKMLAGFMTLCMMATAVPVTALAEDAVAKIGEATYTSLASALEAAEKVTGDVTITLLNDIEEDVTVTQVDGLYLTIDGTDENYTFKGVMTLSGQSKCIENQSTTITNIIFEGTDKDKACIYVPAGGDRYTCNVNVIRCKFQDTENERNIPAIEQATGGCKNWLIQDCLVEDSIHSLLQAKSIDGLKIEESKICSKNGINLNSSDDVEVIDCIFEVSGYAIRTGVAGGDDNVETITLTDNAITTDGSEGDAAIVLRGCAYDAEIIMKNNEIKADQYIDKSGITGEDQTKVVDKGGNKYLVEDAVAEVNDVQYTTLREAVDKAKADDTVTLLKDAEGAGIVIDKDIVIDFGGNTYALTEPVGSTGTVSNGFQILKDNDVTLKNGTLEVAEESAGEFYILVQNYANLKMKDMILDGENLDKYSHTDGDSYTLSNNHGDVVITGNTTIIANKDGNKAFAFDVYDSASYEGVTVTFDEDFEGEVTGNFEVSEGDATLVIYAGTFTMDPTVWVAEGYKAYGEGPWTVERDMDKVVAEVGGKYYETLAAAVEAAESGEEVTLLKNAEGAGIVIDKDITIDFGGYTYTLAGPAVGSSGTETLGFQLKAGEDTANPNKVTFKDGIIEVSASNVPDGTFKVLLMNYCDLTLENVTLDGTNLVADKWVMGNNNGDTVITGETYIVAPEDGVAFDVDDMSDKGWYQDVSVTFDEAFTGGVKGTFYFYEDNTEAATLVIKGGHFTQDPTAYVADDKVVTESDKDGYTHMVGDTDPTPSTSSSKKSSKKYTVDIEDTEDGTVKASSTRVKKDATVTLTVTPDEGYELDDLVVLDKDGEKVKLKDKGNGKYTFTMPRGGVEVEASFVEKEGEKEPVATEKEFIKLTIGQKIVWIFDEYVVNDVAPEIKNDRTMLPIRIIAEALGAKVTWNEAEQKVTITEDDLTIEIFIGQPFATVNGKPVQLDAPAYIANDRTYLPLRFVAENLGATVEWNATDSSVTIFK